MERTMKIYVSLDGREETAVSIPTSIENEVELKVQLRNLGYISTYSDSYRTTRVYLVLEGEIKEICTDQYRSLEELNIGQESHILIKRGVPEPRPIYRYKSVYNSYPRYYRGGGGGKALYGCPMAQSVSEAISEAEQYSDDDSSESTGVINSID